MYSTSLPQENILSKISSRYLIYLVAFLFTLHQAPAVYVISNYLTELVGESKVGFIYSVSSFLTILVFVFIRRVLAKYGNYKTFLTTLFIETAMLLVLLIPNVLPWIAISALVISLITHATAYLHLDIFISHYSSLNDTGSIRSSFLTAQNIAIVIGPLLAGVLLKDHDFWKIFLFGFILMIPTIIISRKHFRKIPDPVYEKTEFVKTGIEIFRDKDIYSIISIHALLRFFYAWMIIYTPIFLTLHIGFSLGETSSIIGIALIAFLILTKPLGHVSDKILGEQEVLILGFIIMSLATASMSFITVKSFWIWATVLFITRVGASMIEVMAESYFFKKIDPNDLNMLSFFRMLRPATYLIFSAMGATLLLIIDIKHLFLILGVLMIYGIKYSLAIKDTR